MCGWTTPFKLWAISISISLCLWSDSFKLWDSLSLSVCVSWQDSFKLWSLSLSVCVAGTTPLSYDLYLYQFVCMDDYFKTMISTSISLCESWLTPLKLWSLSLSVCVSLADSFKLWSLSLSVCVYGMTHFKLWSLSLSVCVSWMTPLNYDLYLYQFISLCGWLTPLNYDLYLYQFLWVWLTHFTLIDLDLYQFKVSHAMTHFKLWSLSVSVCVAGWLL